MGASRDSAHDGARVHPGLGAARRSALVRRDLRRIFSAPDANRLRGPIRCRRVRRRRAHFVGLLFSRLGRLADEPHRILRADVAARLGIQKLDLMNRLSHSHLRLRAILLCAVFLIFGMTPRHARAANNLLQNGNFAKGSEDQPDEWRTEAWINKPEAFLCHSHPSSNGAGELEVDNLQANDGRWMQPLSLGPGWYELSADIRPENVGPKEGGASRSGTA